jgi:excisionase family DNA binding protein
MRAWLRKQINELSAFLGHPEPDEPLFEGCAAIVREAADRAAKAGMLDFYEQHKRVRTCTPRDAVAVLNSMLASLSNEEYLTPPEAARLLGVNPDKVRNWIRSGRLPAIDTAKKTRPRWKIARTDVENLRQTATPLGRRSTRSRDPSVTKYF